MRIVNAILIAVVLSGAWTLFVFFGTNEGWWRTAIAQRDDIDAFAQTITQTIDLESRGNAAFRLIDGGKMFAEHYQSIGEPVDEDTLFQVASLSKWVTAWGVMHLVETGQLDLDTPVSTYLTRWQLPTSEFDEDGVTVRRLLSHTAGFTDGLGYGGFSPDEQTQTIEDSLTKASDASPGADGRTRVGIEPGSEWRYSGGGYTLLQLLIEEVSGQPFNAFMTDRVFNPLGMHRSTFIIEPETDKVAAFYDTDGTEAVHYTFTGLAAASLYTSAADLTRFLAAHVRGPNGEQPGRGVLSIESLRTMREPHGYQMGFEIWGLGTMLLAPNGKGDYVIGHDGSNEPAINTTARVDPASGDGFIMLVTGHPLLATTLGGEWVFWRIGTIDFLTFTIETNKMLVTMAAGWIVIVLLVLAGLLGTKKRS